MSTSQRNNKQVKNDKTKKPPTARQLKKITRNKARRAKRLATDLPRVRPMPPTKSLAMVDTLNDSRSSVSASREIMAPGVTNCINFVIPLASTAMQGASYAYICAALQKGWLANAPAPDYPFAAWRYMANVWSAFINGTVPQGSKMPYWMWALGRAISAKTVPKGRGNVYYKGNIGTAVPTVPAIQLGPVAYNYEGNLWIPGSSSTDMFPDGVAPSIPTIDDKAFISLCGFMESHSNPAISRMCDETVKTSLDRDVSAFATVLDVTGYGNNTNGGAAYLAALEVFVHTPLVTPALTQTQNGLTGSPIRFSARTNAWGGDDLFMANCMSNLLPHAFWRNKISPKFKCIDFREIQEVVAMWAAKIVSQYWADPTLASSTTTTNAQAAAHTICPLTLQEMGLILRNEVMFLFGPTQSGVQSVLPVLPTGSTDNQFMPYLTGTTGSATASYKMKLPLPLVENLRSLILHIVPTVSGKDHELLYPVIGQYANDTLDRADYTFTSLDGDGDKVQTPVFAALPATSRRRKISKGEMWEKTSVETPIDFIDTSNGTAYVFINDATRLTALTAVWNEWVSTFQTYSSPITEVSLDPGVNVLTSINQTRYWINVTPAALERTADVRDERIVQRKWLSDTVYTNRQAFSISYREAPFADTQSITTKWILPIQHLQLGNGSPNASPFVKMQALNGEEFSTATSTTGDSGVSLSTLHSIFADSMVHAKDTESSFDAELKNLTNSGKAGILSSLVAKFAGQAFGTTVGSVANAIADVLPI